MYKNLIIIKNRSDIGAGTRGSDMGIDAMEIAAINKENFYFDKNLFVDVKTYNESIYIPEKNPKAKRIEYIVNHCTRVSDTVRKILSRDNFPLVLSGDHSSALGTISGIKSTYPNKRLGVIWIDAHGDLHSPFTTPSGNVHGMPLAAALNIDNKECQENEPLERTINEWENYKNIGISGPKLLVEDLIFFGVRDTEAPEDHIISKHGIRNFKVNEYREKGTAACVQEAFARLESCDIIYISFDVDSMDADLVSSGTGTPVSNGFTPTEIVALFSHLLVSEKIVCVEFTEVNPLLDHKGNKMAETAFDILDQVTEIITKE